MTAKTEVAEVAKTVEVAKTMEAVEAAKAVEEAAMTVATEANATKRDHENPQLNLPLTPQPSDSEEDEPPRKRRYVEQCELAKVNIYRYM